MFLPENCLQSEGEMVNTCISVHFILPHIALVLNTRLPPLLVLLLQGLGSVSFQSFHQRTLSASSAQTAQLTCYAAAFVIVVLGIPPVLVGAVAASTGRNQFRDDSSLKETLPLWPGAVCIYGQSFCNMTLKTA